MDIQHVTLLHTLRIFQDKKHLCSSQLHLKHYCTIHFSFTLTHNTAVFRFISFFGTEVGVESWSRVKSSLYLHSVDSADRPKRLLFCSGGSADFLHRHIWLTCHTSCSWIPVSWRYNSPPLTVTTPHPSDGSLKEIFWIKQNICLWDCWPTPSLSEIKSVASGRMTHWANGTETERGASSRDQVQSLQEVCFHKCVHTQSKKRSWLNVKMPMMSD